MSKKNKNYHRNVLVSSDQDAIALCFAVQDRFINLVDSHARIKGTPLIPPSDMDKALILWRQMAVRHKSGDFRHSEEEWQALKEIAQWTIDENRKMRNQPPIVVEALKP